MKLHFTNKRLTLGTAPLLLLMSLGTSGNLYPRLLQAQSPDPSESNQEMHRIGSSLASPSPTAPSVARTPSPSSSPSPSPSRSAPSPTAPPPVSATLPGTPIVPDRTLRISSRISRDGEPRFQPPLLEVIAGQTVIVSFSNDTSTDSGSFQNWVLVKPNTIGAVAALGIDAGVDPDAVTYSPDILASTRVAAPGEDVSVAFIAPETPGDYPFVSTLEGQWRRMRGTLRVHPMRRG